MTVTAQPTAVGFITNSIAVVSYTPFLTTATNVVTQVIYGQTDLGVTVTGPSADVFVNDWITYGVTVTNMGPNDAPDVVLSNTFPAGMILLSPTNQPVSTNGDLVYNLGTLANGGSQTFHFSVQPTNAGAQTFMASVSTASLFDPNTTNNSASNSIIVTNYFAGQLVAVTNSAQIINWGNSLIEQTILLSNTGSVAIASARVVITNLPYQLFNAVGTNDGNPFVVYASTLDTNQSVSLLLQFFVPTRSPFPLNNSQLNAFPVSVPDLTPPTPASVSTNPNISRILKLSNGDILIEWPSTVGRIYTVVYSDNVLFSNAMIAPPPIVAPADRTQWIDYGPPTTVSNPANSTNRFYRVYLNP